MTKFGEIHLVLPPEEKELFTRLRDLLERTVTLEERMLQLIEDQVPQDEDEE